MALIPGTTLLEAGLPLEGKVRAVRDAALALDHAHREGIIHRDVKPSNLMIAEGRVYVMDFGLARSTKGDPALTESGVTVGAVEDFDAVLRERPGDAEAWNYRGIARERAGDLEGARSDYSRAVAADPKHASARLNRGLLLRAAGDLPRAIADFTAAVEIDPRYAKAWLARGQAFEALAAADPGNAAARLESARADYLKALEAGGPSWQPRREVEGAVRRLGGK